MYDLFSSEFGYRMRATVSAVRFLTENSLLELLYSAQSKRERVDMPGHPSRT